LWVKDNKGRKLTYLPIEASITVSLTNYAKS
jgi:hypothetical protein